MKESRIIHPVNTATHIRFTINGYTCLSHPSLKPLLADIYAGGQWVYDRLAADPSSTRLRGRRPVWAGTLAGREVVVKRLHHGGMLEPLTGDRFLRSTRFTKPMEVYAYLTRRGIPTPEILFSTFIRRRGFVRGETGSARLPPGADASDTLFPPGAEPPSDAHRLARKIGGFVRRIHDEWFIHPDLNLMNIYFTRSGHLFLLDIDKAVVPCKPPSPGKRRRNLARLERSVYKQGRHMPDDTLIRIIQSIKEGYRNHAAD